VAQWREVATHPLRFYTPRLAAHAEVRLDRTESHHIRHVLRLGPGDEITLFDGTGRECRARILACTRDEVLVETAEIIAVDREAALSLTLAVAMPRGKRADLILEKCTELGVHAFIPVICRHSVADPRVRAAGRHEKWRRLTIEACKQCGRNRLPLLDLPLHFEEAVRRAEYHLRLLATPAPDATPLRGVISECVPGETIIALIGPEGGFTPEEEAQARVAGWMPISLGPRRLRVETAAIALAAAVATAL